MMRLLGSSEFASFLLRWWAGGWSSDLVCSQIHKTSAPPHINKSVPHIHQMLQQVTSIITYQTSHIILFIWWDFLFTFWHQDLEMMVRGKVWLKTTTILVAPTAAETLQQSNYFLLATTGGSYITRVPFCMSTEISSGGVIKRSHHLVRTQSI